MAKVKITELASVEPSAQGSVVVTQNVSGTESVRRTTIASLATLVCDLAGLEAQPLAFKAAKVGSSSSDAAATYVAEKGSTISELYASWQLNKTPGTVTVGGTSMTAAKAGSGTLSGSWTADATISFTASTSGGETAAGTARIRFGNWVYWGAGATADLEGLSKALATSRGRTFTATAGEGAYVWLCLPRSMGTPTFTVGGFEGGFVLESTASVENAQGYSEDYDFWKSRNPGLGAVSVTVS